MTRPSTGRFACSIATIWANTAFCIATMPRLRRSVGVLTLAADAPAGSANLVCVSFIVVARTFILSTKAGMEPASHRAIVSAKLFADGMSIPSRTCSSLSCSPAWTLTTDCLSAKSAWYACTSTSVNVIVGPASSFLRGLSSSTMSAVITLVTLAAGRVFSLPELATKPRPDTPTAAAPWDGHGSAGAVPGTTSVGGSFPAAATAGIGRK